MPKTAKILVYFSLILGTSVSESLNPLNLPGISPDKCLCAKNCVFAAADEASPAISASTEPAEEILYLNDGRKLKGKKIGESREYIKFRNKFGNSGEIVVRVLKKDILRTEETNTGNLPVSEKPAWAKEGLAGFDFYPAEEYDFFTDENYFRIAESSAVLKNLRRAFAAFFQPLYKTNAAKRSRVIIFKNPRDFFAFRNKEFPGAENTVGFYNPGKGYLAVYNFFNDESYGKARGQAQEELEKLRKNKNEGAEQYGKSLSSYLSRIALNTKAVNLQILRHEAAHQLSFDMGIITPFHFDTWIIEGLAQYCSTPYIGEKITDEINIIEKAASRQQLIPLKKLFNYTANEEFYKLDKETSSLAYAQSWALFYYLMNSRMRDKFFAYLEILRDSDIASVEQRIKLMEKTMGFSSGEIEKEAFNFK